MSDLKMNKEDGVESYEFATPEAIEEALKIGKLSQTVFGMGCFWGPDSNFGGTQGVVQTRVGYAGASTLDPSYRNIKGHAEVVRVIYDKDQISYIVKLLYYSYKIRKKLEITHRLSRSTILYAYV